MTTETSKWEALRRPFSIDEIELLPRYTGKKGPDGKPPREAYRRCAECGGFHPFPCVHLNYVGHAQITDRLNEVDPEWNWEPCALDADGNPLIKDGGMWIRLTVLGVTRYGYGDAQGKRGHDATKEIIGDAIRNAAMRFGVASYLWSKSERAKEKLVEGADEKPAEAPQKAEKAPSAQAVEFARLKAACAAYEASHPRPDAEAGWALEGVQKRPDLPPRDAPDEERAAWFATVADEFESCLADKGAA